MEIAQINKISSSAAGNRPCGAGLLSVFFLLSVGVSTAPQSVAHEWKEGASEGPRRGPWGTLVSAEPVAGAARTAELPPSRRVSRNVEGCFSSFDAEEEVRALDGGFFMNNARCQAACVDRGFALAATRSNTTACLCGNNYPSVFRQVSCLVRVRKLASEELRTLS